MAVVLPLVFPGPRSTLAPPRSRSSGGLARGRTARIGPSFRVLSTCQLGAESHVRTTLGDEVFQELELTTDSIPFSANLKPAACLKSIRGAQQICMGPRWHSAVRITSPLSRVVDAATHRRPQTARRASRVDPGVSTLVATLGEGSVPAGGILIRAEVSVPNLEPWKRTVVSAGAGEFIGAIYTDDIRRCLSTSRSPSPGRECVEVEGNQKLKPEAAILHHMEMLRACPKHLEMMNKHVDTLLEVYDDTPLDDPDEFENRDQYVIAVDKLLGPVGMQTLALASSSRVREERSGGASRISSGGTGLTYRRGSGACSSRYPQQSEKDRTAPLPSSIFAEAHKKEMSVLSEISSSMAKVAAESNIFMAGADAETATITSPASINELLLKVGRDGQARADKIGHSWIMYVMKELHGLESVDSPAVSALSGQKPLHAVKSALHERAILLRQYKGLKRRKQLLTSNMKELTFLTHRKPEIKSSLKKIEESVMQRLRDDFLAVFNKETNRLLEQDRARAEHLKEEAIARTGRRRELRSHLHDLLIKLKSLLIGWTRNCEEDLRVLLTQKSSEIQQLFLLREDAFVQESTLKARLQSLNDGLRSLHHTDAFRRDLNVDMVLHSSNLTLSAPSNATIIAKVLEHVGDIQNGILPGARQLAKYLSYTPFQVGLEGRSDEDKEGSWVGSSTPITSQYSVFVDLLKGWFPTEPSSFVCPVRVQGNALERILLTAKRVLAEGTIRKSAENDQGLKSDRSSPQAGSKDVRFGTKELLFAVARIGGPRQPSVPASVRLKAPRNGSLIEKVDAHGKLLSSLDDVLRRSEIAARWLSKNTGVEAAGFAFLGCESALIVILSLLKESGYISRSCRLYASLVECRALRMRQQALSEALEIATSAGVVTPEMRKDKIAPQKLDVRRVLVAQRALLMCVAEGYDWLRARAADMLSEASASLLLISDQLQEVLALVEGLAIDSVQTEKHTFMNNLPVLLIACSRSDPPIAQILARRSMKALEVVQRSLMVRRMGRQWLHKVMSSKPSSFLIPSDGAGTVEQFENFAEENRSAVVVASDDLVPEPLIVSEVRSRAASVEVGLYRVDMEDTDSEGNMSKEFSEHQILKRHSSKYSRASDSHRSPMDIDGRHPSKCSRGPDAVDSRESSRHSTASDWRRSRTGSDLEKPESRQMKGHSRDDSEGAKSRSKDTNAIFERLAATRLQRGAETAALRMSLSESVEAAIVGYNPVDVARIAERRSMRYYKNAAEDFDNSAGGYDPPSVQNELAQKPKLQKAVARVRTVRLLAAPPPGLLQFASDSPVIIGSLSCRPGEVVPMRRPPSLASFVSEANATDVEPEFISPRVPHWKEACVFGDVPRQVGSGKFPFASSSVGLSATHERRETSRSRLPASPEPSRPSLLYEGTRPKDCSLSVNCGLEPVSHPIRRLLMSSSEPFDGNVPGYVFPSASACETGHVDQVPVNCPEELRDACMPAVEVLALIGSSFQEPTCPFVEFEPRNARGITETNVAKGLSRLKPLGLRQTPLPSDDGGYCVASHPLVPQSAPQSEKVDADALDDGIQVVFCEASSKVEKEGEERLDHVKCKRASLQRLRAKGWIELMKLNRPLALEAPSHSKFNADGWKQQVQSIENPMQELLVEGTAIEVDAFFASQLACSSESESDLFGERESGLEQPSDPQISFDNGFADALVESSELMKKRKLPGRRPSYVQPRMADALEPPTSNMPELSVTTLFVGENRDHHLYDGFVADDAVSAEPYPSEGVYLPQSELSAEDSDPLQRPAPTGEPPSRQDPFSDFHRAFEAGQFSGYREIIKRARLVGEDAMAKASRARSPGREVKRCGNHGYRVFSPHTIQHGSKRCANSPTLPEVIAPIVTADEAPSQTIEICGWGSWDAKPALSRSNSPRGRSPRTPSKPNESPPRRSLPVTASRVGGYRGCSRSRESSPARTGALRDNPSPGDDEQASPHETQKLNEPLAVPFEETKLFIPYQVVTRRPGSAIAAQGRPRSRYAPLATGRPMPPLRYLRESRGF